MLCLVLGLQPSQCQHSPHSNCCSCTSSPFLPAGITAAVIANAPGIAAAVGGFAAAKVAMEQTGGRRGAVMPDKRPLADDKPVAARPVVARKELPPTYITISMSYEE